MKEIYDLNTMIAKEMENIFVRKGIPVVPSLGEFERTRPGESLTRLGLLWLQAITIYGVCDFT